MKKNRWLMFIVLYFSALAISLNMFKVPPIMGELAKIFQVSITSVAWMMSIFTVAGIVLAIPSAMILDKLGPKKLGILLMIFLWVGSLIGGFAPNFTILLVSRAIEGIGFALIILLGMVLITSWFEPDERGIPTGIFLTFPAVAPFIMLNLGAQIASSMGWNFLWILGAIMAGIALVLFVLIIDVPAPQKPQNNNSLTEQSSISVMEGLSNSRSFVLGIVQGSVSFILFSFLTIYPLIFAQFYKLDIIKANSYASLAGLFGIFTCILSGIIIARTKKPDLIIVFSFIGLIITAAFTFKLSQNTYILHILLISLFTGLIIPSVYTLAPLVAKKPSLIGYSIALVNLIYYIGTFIGAPIVTAVVESNRGNWSSAARPIIIVSVIGAIASILFINLNERYANQLGECQSIASNHKL